MRARPGSYPHLEVSLGTPRLAWKYYTMVDVIERDERCSLPRYGSDYECKMFYETGLRIRPVGACLPNPEAAFMEMPCLESPCKLRLLRVEIHRISYKKVTKKLRILFFSSFVAIRSIQQESFMSQCTVSLSLFMILVLYLYQKWYWIWNTICKFN